MTSLRPISAPDFERWQPALKIIVHQHARKFAALSLESGCEVALSWRSDLIDPAVVPGSQSDVWIGVDQRVVCMDRDGHTVLSLALASSLLSISPFSQCCAVLCETEAILFNNDYTIRKIEGLPDVPNEIVEHGGKFVVTLDDGTQVTVG